MESASLLGQLARAACAVSDAVRAPARLDRHDPVLLDNIAGVAVRRLRLELKLGNDLAQNIATKDRIEPN